MSATATVNGSANATAPDDVRGEIAPWEEWNPRDYNTEYYSEITLDGWYLMQWVVESVRHVGPVDVALEFGAGPTVLHTFPFVPKAKEIHLAEFLPVNRDELKRWVDGESDVHDWRQFTLEFLRLEGNLRPTEEEAQARENEIRKRITQILPGDANDENPLGADKRGFYPLVSTLCCAEGSTTSKETWYRYMKNIMSLVAPGGTLIQSVCEGCQFYCVGPRRFPGAGVDRRDVLEVYTQNGFVDIDMRIRHVPGIPGGAFDSTILVRGKKRV